MKESERGRKREIKREKEKERKGEKRRQNLMDTEWTVFPQRKRSSEKTRPSEREAPRKGCSESNQKSFNDANVNATAKQRHIELQSHRHCCHH